MLQWHGRARHSQTRQALVTNIDSAFLVMGLEGDFNLRRLERYLALAKSAGVMPVVVLSKADLCPSVDTRLAALVERLPPSVERYAVNATDAASVECLARRLAPGDIAVLLRSSGAGKSTSPNSGRRLPHRHAGHQRLAARHR